MTLLAGNIQKMFRKLLVIPFQNKFLGDKAMICSLTVKVMVLCINYEEGEHWKLGAEE